MPIDIELHVTSAAFSLFLLGFKGASVKSTGCYQKRDESVRILSLPLCRISATNKDTRESFRTLAMFLVNLEILPILALITKGYEFL